MIDTIRATAASVNADDPEPFASLFAGDAMQRGRLWWKRTTC